MADARTGGLAANALLAAAALLLTFAVLEVGVRLLVDMELEVPRAVYDVDPEQPIFFLPHRERSYETREFVFTVRTNSHGRRDVEWDTEVLADPRSVLFIGDSLTVGYGVEHDHTMPSRLEALLAAEGRPTEVLNFGIPGGSPVDYVRLLDAALDAGVAARVVLVGIFVGNDFYREVLEPRPTRAAAEPPPERGWRPRSELLRLLRLRVSHSARTVGWILTLGRLTGINVYDTSGSYVFLRVQTQEQEQIFERILSLVSDMADTAASHGRVLLPVVIPNKIQVENADELRGAVYDPERPNRRILAFCEERGLRCLDLLPALRDEYLARGEALYFPIDRHFTQRGNEVAARAIRGFLRDAGQLP